ncbi:MAG: DNA/RNA nuclease SfsA [Calditrichaeota bacterium]|nr:MAG: DNA/RNA nuclease SfsA [Calditrichota bacterium]
MIFDPPLIQGKLIRRYKRFLADIELDNGEIVIAHCPNSGRMTGCADPGSTVFVAPAANPKRKLKFTWELTKLADDNWVGINTMRTNRIVEEALIQKKVPELVDNITLQREVKYGEKSRIDFLITMADGAKKYVEVKNVSLVEDGIAKFPDAVTTRGQKHLQELMTVVEAGHGGTMLFLVNRQDATNFQAAVQIDPRYAELLSEAKNTGVEVLVYQTMADNQSISLGKSLSFNI